MEIHDFGILVASGLRESVGQQSSSPQGWTIGTRRWERERGPGDRTLVCQAILIDMNALKRVTIGRHSNSSIYFNFELNALPLLFGPVGRGLEERSLALR